MEAVSLRCATKDDYLIWWVQCALLLAFCWPDRCYSQVYGSASLAARVADCFSCNKLVPWHVVGRDSGDPIDSATVAIASDTLHIRFDAADDRPDCLW